MKTQILGTVAPALLGSAPLPLIAADSKAKPNVLFIAVDDLNHWVGHLKRNPRTITPHLDRLASWGVSSSNAYCAAPACNPSRAALMSGMRPSTTGVYLNSNDHRPHIDPKYTDVKAELAEWFPNVNKAEVVRSR